MVQSIAKYKKNLANKESVSNAYKALPVKKIVLTCNKECKAVITHLKQWISSLPSYWANLVPQWKEILTGNEKLIAAIAQYETAVQDFNALIDQGDYRKTPESYQKAQEKRNSITDQKTTLISAGINQARNRLVKHLLECYKLTVLQEFDQWLNSQDCKGKVCSS